MIYTCTLNPAVDKIAYVDKIQINQMNRLLHVESDAGGKGINVSRNIRILNHRSTAIGFLGGSAGTYIETLLENEGIEHNMIGILGNTRTNLKVFDADGMSEFNEEGPFVLKDEWDLLYDYFCEHLDCNSILVISGSAPKGCGRDAYQKLIEVAHENGAIVFMDTSLKYLVPALEAHPEIVKISSKELAALNHIDAPLSESEIISFGRNLMEESCEMMCVSHEKMGLYLLTKTKVLHCEPLELETKSRVGVGDAFVAGFVVGLEKGFSDEEVLRLAGGVYAAASQQTTCHAKSYDDVLRYMDKIKITRV